MEQLLYLTGRNGQRRLWISEVDVTDHAHHRMPVASRTRLSPRQCIQRLLLSKARDNLEPVGAYKGHKSMVGAHGGQGTNRARQGVTNRADNHAMGSRPLAEEGADTQRRWKGLASVTVGD